MRHVVDEVYDQFVEAETDGSVSPAISSDALARARPFRWNDSITLREISFCYPADRGQSLDQVSLSYRQKTLLSVWSVQPARGKSTFVDLLLGLPKTNRRRNCLIDDKPLTSALVPALAGFQFGYVPQDIFLIDDTIARNIAFGLPDTEVDPGAIARSLCLRRSCSNSSKRELPAGFDTDPSGSVTSVSRVGSVSVLVLRARFTIVHRF